MEKLVIHGTRPLVGSVAIEGAKNAVLPIMAASLLAETGTLALSNVPALSDVKILTNLLQALGVKADFDAAAKQLTLDATGPLTSVAPLQYVAKMRASIVVLGPLLARLGKAQVALPGGCAIGSRPIDLHLKGLRALGAKITQTNGNLTATASKLHGADIYLDFPSVGATQNILLAATLAEGQTTLKNAAREPEIVDLVNVLVKMGAKISGAGTSTIKITGVPALHGADHVVVQDRIEAGTFMVAAAATGGNVLIKDAIYPHNAPLLAKLAEMGVTVTQEVAGIRIQAPATPTALKPAHVTTLPHPGFPTDEQAQLTVLQLLASGVSTMKETVFENRFMHLAELRRMNAEVVINDNMAVLHGPTTFSGAKVFASDLRAAAALVIAGLTATGTTEVHNLQYLDRGYLNFHTKLQALGADISRQPVAPVAATTGVQSAQ